MITIITSTGDSLTSRFDLRFGRAAWFCIFDENSGVTEFIENSAGSEMNGTGVKAAEIAAAKGARKIISGDFGPKARDLLEQLKIQMVILQDNELSVGEIIDRITRTSNE